MYISSYCAIKEDGIYSVKNFTAWENGQCGPEDIQRSQVLGVPYLSFGKLNLADRLVFSAGALLFNGLNAINNEKCGITIGLPFGSLSTDLRYVESIQNGFPSPAIFSATLPSSPLAEIAIYYKCKGPDRVYAGGDAPCLNAFDTAYWLIESGKADIMAFIGAWVVDSKDLTALQICKSTFKNEVYGILLSRESLSENCTSFNYEIANTQSSKQIGEQELFSDLIAGLFEKQKKQYPINISPYTGYISLV